MLFTRLLLFFAIITVASTRHNNPFLNSNDSAHVSLNCTEINKYSWLLGNHEFGGLCNQLFSVFRSIIAMYSYVLTL